MSKLPCYLCSFHMLQSNAPNPSSWLLSTWTKNFQDINWMEKVEEPENLKLCQCSVDQRSYSNSRTTSIFQASADHALKFLESKVTIQQTGKAPWKRCKYQTTFTFLPEKTADHDNKEPQTWEQGLV